MTKLDKSGYEQLFRQHYAALCRYGLSIIGDADQSEDIVQQVFVKLWNKRSEMDMSRSLKSYLFTSVRNACINYIRDTKKFQSEILDIEIYANDVASGFTDGATNLLAGELEQRIRSAMNKLPEKSLEVFQMSRTENLKYKEIAEKLGVTVKTVEAHMSKALKMLREELKDYLVFLILAMLKNLLF